MKPRGKVLINPRNVDTINQYRNNDSLLRAVEGANNATNNMRISISNNPARQNEVSVIDAARKEVEREVRNISNVKRASTTILNGMDFKNPEIQKQPVVVEDNMPKYLGLGILASMFLFKG